MDGAAEQVRSEANQGHSHFRSVYSFRLHKGGALRHDSDLQSCNKLSLSNTGNTLIIHIRIPKYVNHQTIFLIEFLTLQKVYNGSHKFFDIIND
ncbi:MAG: hypothetical protein ACI8Z1_001468 [Candidatus Azotimanducaceae bacterium]|jgi:hypothetical protein